MPWLRLIRWQNLLIIFLTQLLAWGCIVLPENPKILTPLNFLLLSLSTMLIAAAGYIINDYFDVKIDIINNPEKVILEKVIPRKQAIIAHTLLNVIALAVAGKVAVEAGHPEWLLFQLCCTLLLWFYSTDFKRQYVTGNIIVALLTAMTVGVFFVYEPQIFFRLRTSRFGDRLFLPGWILCVYAYFAFMLTWMREIVKDMEDLKGDQAEGCITMPIRKGLKFSRTFTTVLSLLVIMPLCLGSFVLFAHHYVSMSVYVLVLVSSLVAWTTFLYRRNTQAHYHSTSQYLKAIMILGICSFIIYYLQLYLNSAT